MAKLAKFASMPKAYDLHSLQVSSELPSAPSSELKNAFKSVFQQATQAGPVSITRNRKREAILLPADLYDQIIGELAAHDPLEALRKEYDARFASLQSKDAQAAYRAAFSASPGELGEAAVTQATKRR